MVVQPCECIKASWTAYFKWVKFIICDLYLSKNILYLTENKEIKKWRKVESQKVTSADLDKMVREGTEGAVDVLPPALSLWFTIGWILVLPAALPPPVPTSLWF